MRDTEERLRELEQQVEELSGDLRVLRTLVEQDHASALNKIRYVTEKVLHGLCAKHKVSWGTKEPTLESMIGPLIAAKVIPKNVTVHVRTVQTNASPGSHFQEDALSATHVQVAQIALLELLEWYYRGEGTGADTPAVTGAPSASTSLPRAKLKPPKPRVPVVPLVIALVAVAGGVGWWVMRGRGDGGEEKAEGKAADLPVVPLAAPPLRQPKAGLDAVARYEHPEGEAEELASETLWQAAADDFARSAAQPGSPVRWQAGEKFARAQVAIIRGELDGALDGLRAAAELDGAWPAVHAAISTAQSRKGQLDAALAAAREAQRMEPEAWLWVAIGARAYRAANRLDDAIGEFRRALTMAPDEPVLLAELSLVFHAAAMDGEAERFALDALAQDPDLIGPRILLAERALEKRDGKRALAEAQTALATSPRSVSALLALADAYALLGRREDAMAGYRKAIDEQDRVKGKGASEARLEVVRKALAGGKLPAPRGGDVKKTRSRSKSGSHPLEIDL